MRVFKVKIRTEQKSTEKDIINLLFLMNADMKETSLGRGAI